MGLMLALTLLAVFAPADVGLAQPVVRQAMLRSPFGQVIKCDEASVFRHDTATTVQKSDLAQTLFTLKLLGGDSNNDQVFQIGCRNANGQLGWFSEPSPGRFSWASIEPAPDDAKTLFVGHVNPGQSLRVYIKAPSGGWFSFVPFNATSGPFTTNLVPEGSNERYNFELYYENEFPVPFLKVTVDCPSLPGENAQGYCAFVHRDHPNSWVRGKASLNLDTNILSLEMMLETDSNDAGPIGTMSVTLLDSLGQQITSVMVGPIGIGGRKKFRVRREVATATVSVPQSVVATVARIEVSVERTGIKPGVFGFDGVGIGNVIDAAKVILGGN